MSECKHAVTLSEIPTIDVSSFASACSSDEVRSEQLLVAGELRRACIESGFFYVKGHGCPKEVRENAFRAMNSFFDLPIYEKAELDATKTPLYRGYVQFGGPNGCTRRDDRPDFKETYLMGAIESKEGCDSPMHGPNQWPSSDVCPGFELALKTYWDTLLNETSVRIMRALALSLGESEDYFVKQCDDPVAQMILVRYPPSSDHQKGCGAHTDCGFLTILAQDQSGLQVRHADGRWIHAEPVEDTFVVNIGDMAARWTGDLYKSTQHRVYNMSTTTTRHSIPFFINCNFDAQVQTIPSCKALGMTEYPPCIAGEYMMRKLRLIKDHEPVPYRKPHRSEPEPSLCKERVTQAVSACM